MKKGKITIKDVAEYASVSPATVSRVLNDYKWINSEVKERVQKAIDELHYVPDFTAKQNFYPDQCWSLSTSLFFIR